MNPRPKMAKFVLTTWAACFARQNPVSTSANPACMKITRTAPMITHNRFRCPPSSDHGIGLHRRETDRERLHPLPPERVDRQKRGGTGMTICVSPGASCRGGVSRAVAALFLLHVAFVSTTSSDCSLDSVCGQSATPSARRTAAFRPAVELAAVAIGDLEPAVDDAVIDRGGEARGMHVDLGTRRTRTRSTPAARDGPDFE